MELSGKKLYIFLFLSNSFIFFFQGIAKNIYTPLVSPFKEVLAISSAQAGFLITLVFLGYALARFPSGVLTDVLGCERTILLGSGLMGITLILVGFSQTYIFLALFTFIMGVSTGLYVTAGYTYAVNVGFRDRETTFTALFELFGGGAALLAPMMVVWYLEDWELGWQNIFFTLGIGVVLAGLLFYRFTRARLEQEEGTRNRFSRDEFKEEVLQALGIFKKPGIRRFVIWATLVGGLGHFANLGFSSFIPSYLYEVRGYEFSTANQMFMIISIAGLVTKIFVGWLADKVGNKKVLSGILLTNLVLFYVFTADVGHLLTVVILVLFGFTFVNHNTLINSYMLKVMPEEQRGTGFGLFCTLYTVIYSMGPVVTGFFSDHFSMVFGMRTAAVGIIAAGILIRKFDTIVGRC